MLSIGIYITESSVHFAELSLKGSKPTLTSFEEHFFENREIEEERILFISRYIEKIEERHKGKTLRFCYGLSQNSVTSFLVEFPFKEKFKILKTIPFEIEDKSPFRPDKVFFDSRICRIKDQNKSTALCFITPEENINEFLQFSSRLKKPPYLLSCEASALANLLEFWNKPLSQIQNPMPHSVYIYLGAQNSQVLFYKEGYLEHVSVLDWAVADIIKEMEKLYRLTTQKAWEEFFGKSFILTETKGFTKEQMFFSNLIKKKIDLLIPKLQLLKMSLETDQQTQIEEAVLFGPGAGIKNLTAFLTVETSIKFSRLKTFTGFPSFEPHGKPSALIPLGLALEGLKRSPYQGLNFLQSLRKETFSLFPKRWRVAGLAFFLFFVVFTFYAFIRRQESSRVLDKIQSVFVDYGKRITFMQESQINVESINSFLEKEKAKVQNERIVKDKLSLSNPLDKLQIITQKLGDASKWNLTISYLKVEDRQVEIKGLLNRSSLQSFKSQLQSLAKGQIKEVSSQDEAFVSPVNKELSKMPPEAVDLNLSEKTEGDLQKESQEKEKPGLKAGPDLDTLGPDTNLKQEERSFFSYSFELKEDF